MIFHYHGVVDVLINRNKGTPNVILEGRSLNDTNKFNSNSAVDSYL